MNEQTVSEFLQNVIEQGDEEGSVRTVRTFEEAGVMAYNNGLVIRMQDGTEFQITIVQSK